MGKKSKKQHPSYLNREIQWLEFNRRVLNEAQDDRTPLLERVNFLGIFTSNLDEFIMKRVGGIKRQIDFGITSQSVDDMDNYEQLNHIRNMVLSLVNEQSQIYKKLRSQLEKRSIILKKWTELTKEEQAYAQDYYRNNVFPVLTPLVVDPAHPFPFISNLSISLGVGLKVDDSEELLFARIKVPEVFPQWLHLDTVENKKQNVFVSLVQVIQYNLEDLFPSMKVVDILPFRVTRNADLERDEEDAEDLLELITEELKQRRFAEAVRLEHGGGVPWMVDMLKSELELDDDDVYEMKGLLDYTSLKPIYKLKLPHLNYPHWEPQVPTSIQESVLPLFDTIKRSDILVHHPYESFKFSVERFISMAAKDPQVLAIKMTLYRMGDNNPIINALIRAAEQGKQVVCVIELKARFDEKRNIYWAQQMEKAGIHVVYGIVGYKVHSKTTLVLRQEKGEIVAYGHLGTGNYNNITARLYTDVGIFTCNKKITEDMVQLFHLLTSRSFDRQFEHLLVAPGNMRIKFQELIQREIQNAKKGKPARIIAKFNSLEDREITDLLYSASQVGVQIDLIVRGFCCLIPGLKGLSENIRVISVIGRFLEHSRIFYFKNAKDDPLDGDFFIGSADWMYRNLNRRIEVAVPIYERKLKRRCWEILDLALADQRQAWDMQSDGTYIQRVEKNPEDVYGSQDRLMQASLLRAEPLVGPESPK